MDSEQFFDAVDWEENKKNARERELLNTEKERLACERKQLEGEKMQFYWEKGQLEQEKVRLQWEWSRLEGEKVMVQREKLDIKNWQERERIDLEEERGRLDWEWKRIDEKKSDMCMELDEMRRKLKDEGNTNDWLKKEVKTLKRKFHQQERRERQFDDEIS